MSALPVQEALDGALSLLSGRIRNSGVSIARPEPDPSLEVMASRIRLEQILVNLLQNALDALKDQRGRRASRSRSSSATSLSPSRFADNGPGLDRRGHGGNLFMPFQTSKETGLGLGLVISQEIAREFGGSLRFGPTGGRGAVFHGRADEGGDEQRRRR